MRNFLFKSLLMSVFVIFSIFIIYSIPVKTPDYNKAIINKHNLLKTDTSPRIIFIGGSNLAFGLDSELISKEMDAFCINMGININMGLEFMLNEIKPHIKENDIVVIVPEYELFFTHLTDGDGETLLHLLNINPCFIRYFTLKQIKIIITSTPEIFKFKVKALKKQLWKEEIGTLGDFNKYGDLISHLEKEKDLPAWYNINDQIINLLKGKISGNKIKKLNNLNLDRVSKNTIESELYSLDFTEEEIEKVLLYASPKIYISEKFNSKTLKILNDFNKYTNKKGAKFFLCFPPIPVNDYEANKEKINFLYNTLKEKLEFNVLNNPQAYTFTDEFFYNGSYHLNNKGRFLRTKKILEDLKQY